jgi:hypothetical protein
MFEWLISLITSTLGIGLIELILIFVWGLAIILSAVDLRVSAVLTFVLSGALTITAYYNNTEMYLPIISLVASLIFLSLSFLITLKHKVQVI